MALSFFFCRRSKKDETKAFEYYKNQPIKDIQMQVQLGYLYNGGQGTKKDLEKAVYKKTADNGDKITQYNLGECYELGNGVVKDEIKDLNIIKNLLKVDI